MMVERIAAMAVLALALAPLSPPAGAQPWAADRAEASGNGLQIEAPRLFERGGGTVRYYDPSGRPAGRAERRGGVTRLFDRAGRPAGRLEHRGGTVRVYDQYGRFAGRVVLPSRRR